MAKVLFLDGCARGWEVSRTYAVAESFMQSYKRLHPTDEVEEVHIPEEQIRCLRASTLEQRDRLLSMGAQIAAEFALARQFAQADKILLAAPYWDMSFPAIVKAYIENICVNGITFGYGPGGETRGLCMAKKFFYLTTSGGIVDEAGDGGAVLSYMRALCGMLGIPSMAHLWLHGLDLKENSSMEIVEKGRARAVEIAQTW